MIDKIAGRYGFSIGLESVTFSCLWTLHSDDRMRDLAVTIRNISWREPELWAEEEFPIEPESQQRLYHLLPEELVNRSVHAHELITTLTRIAYISAPPGKIRRSSGQSACRVANSDRSPGLGTPGETQSLTH